MAHELVERSAKVTLFDVRPPREPPAASGERLAEAIERGDIGFHQVDVRDRAAVRAALELLDPFDVVTGNAGISQSAPFLEVTDDQRQRHLDVNLTGNFCLGQEAARLMVQRGSGGHIIFTGSWVQDVPWPEIAA